MNVKCALAVFNRTGQGNHVFFLIFVFAVAEGEGGGEQQEQGPQEQFDWRFASHISHFLHFFRRYLQLSELREDQKLHVHSFVVVAANDGAQDLILAGLGRRDQRELLRARLQLQVPARDLGAVLGAEQGESVDRSITVPRFALARRNSQQQGLT